MSTQDTDIATVQADVPHLASGAFAAQSRVDDIGGRKGDGQLSREIWIGDVA